MHYTTTNITVHGTEIDNSHLLKDRLALPDRIILENIIIPSLDKGTVCFIGVSKHNGHYNKLFKHSEVHGIDITRTKQLKRFKNFKVLDARLMHTEYPEEFFDHIICYGVAGYGADDTKSVEMIFDSCYKVIKKNGVFVWGFADCDEKRIIDPVFINHKFKPIIFETFGTWRYQSARYNIKDEYKWSIEKILETNATFDFYTKE